MIINKLRKNLLAVLFFVMLIITIAIYFVLMLQNFNGDTVADFAIVTLFGVFTCFWYYLRKHVDTSESKNMLFCNIIILWHGMMFVICAVTFAFNEYLLFGILTGMLCIFIGMRSVNYKKMPKSSNKSN